jgi:hypothetical protein
MKAEGPPTPAGYGVSGIVLFNSDLIEIAAP